MLGSSFREVFEQILPYCSKKQAPYWRISQDHYAIHWLSLEQILCVFERGLSFKVLDNLYLLEFSPIRFAPLYSMACSQLHKQMAFGHTFKEWLNEQMERNGVCFSVEQDIGQRRNLGLGFLEGIRAVFGFVEREQFPSISCQLTQLGVELHQ